MVEQAAFGELLSYSLERLSKEPELLKAEREQLRRHGQVTYWQTSLPRAQAALEPASKCLPITKPA